MLLGLVGVCVCVGVSGDVYRSVCPTGISLRKCSLTPANQGRSGFGPIIHNKSLTARKQYSNGFYQHRERRRQQYGDVVETVQGKFGGGASKRKRWLIFGRIRDGIPYV